MKVLKVNLLPPEVKEFAGIQLPPYIANLDPGLVFIVLVGTLSALLLPAGLTGFVETSLLAPAEEQIKVQDTELTKTKAGQRALLARQKALQAKESAYTALQAKIERSNPWAEVLEELRMLTPTDLWLTDLTANGDGFVLKGASLDSRSVAYLYTNLQTARHFSDPVLRPIRLQSDKEGAMMFEISVRLKKPTGPSTPRTGAASQEEIEATTAATSPTGAPAAEGAASGQSAPKNGS
ncbi:MAG: PilN domain-containing protein [Candidatus Sericytochromatia bacterium]|nr:PilN domain-containing protein [Candidatus Sericytochromatia bacterium]